MGLPPLSARVLSSGLSCDRAASPRNSSTVPPPPSRPEYVGEGITTPNTQADRGCRTTRITLSSFHTHPLTLYMGSAICTDLATISMKVEWVPGAPSHLHTQLYTQVLGSLCSGGQGLPSTIVFLLSLWLHPAMVWAAKYSRGAKG